MRRGLTFVPLALAITAIMEIVVFVLVGRALGFGLATILVLALSLLGMLLLRREGVRAWRGFRAAAQAGQPPGDRVADGLVGLAAGLLLAVPGFVTGAVGLLLALPPARQLARRRAQVAAERRVSAAVAGDLFGPRRVRVHRGVPQPAEDQAAPMPPGDPGPPLEGEIVEPGRR